MASRSCPSAAAPARRKRPLAGLSAAVQPHAAHEWCGRPATTPSIERVNLPSSWLSFPRTLEKGLRSFVTEDVPFLSRDNLNRPKRCVHKVCHTMLASNCCQYASSAAICWRCTQVILPNVNLRETHSSEQGAAHSIVRSRDLQSTIWIQYSEPPSYSNESFSCICTGCKFRAKVHFVDAQGL